MTHHVLLEVIAGVLVLAWGLYEIFGGGSLAYEDVVNRLEDPFRLVRPVGSIEQPSGDWTKQGTMASGLCSLNIEGHGPDVSLARVELSISTADLAQLITIAPGMTAGADAGEFLDSADPRHYPAAHRAAMSIFIQNVGHFSAPGDADRWLDDAFQRFSGKPDSLPLVQRAKGRDLQAEYDVKQQVFRLTIRPQ